MERQAKDGTFYRQVGPDQWTPVTRTAKDGTVYKKVGPDQWTPQAASAPPTASGPAAPAAQAPAPSRRAEAALEGFGQAATLGYLPQLQALASKPLSKVYGLVTGKEVPVEEDYVASRDAFIRRGEALAEGNPNAYLGGQLAGSLTMPGLGAAKGASVAGRLGKAALAGGLTGAAYNPGDVEGETSDLQLKERGEKALTGALTGGLGQAALSGSGKALSMWTKKGQGLKKASNMMAVTAAGAKTGEIRRLYDKKSLQSVGEFLKKEKLVGPGLTVQDTLDGANRILSETGPQIKQIYSLVQTQLQDPDFLASLSKEKIAKLRSAQLSPYEMVDELSQFFEKELKGKAGGRQILARISGELENLKDLGRTADLQDVLAFRRGVDDLINYDKSISDLPGAQQALKKMRDYLKTKTDAQVEAMDALVGGNSLAKLKELNKRYWGASEAESIAKRAMAREESKMIAGLPELIVGTGVGGADATRAVMEGRPEDLATSVAKGALAGAALKGARKYGPGLATLGADKAGGLLMSDPTRQLTGPAAGLIDKASPGLVGSAAVRTSEKPRLKRKKKGNDDKGD